MRADETIGDDLHVSIGKMHESEVDIDAQLVRRLLLEQLPHLSDLPIREVRPRGTVNAIFRLGSDLCVRMPRVPRWSDSLAKELEWLTKLVGHVPLAIPEPVAIGKAGCGYAFPWAIYRWISGESYAPDRVHDEVQAAEALANFVVHLRRVDPACGPPTGRAPLLQLDADTRATIRSLHDTLDAEAVTAAWDTSLEAPPWNGEPVWLHCDLIPPNLLVDGGQLKAVIDFGSAGIGDPAQDVVPAWSVFGREGRQAFRDALGVDEQTWARARGFALHQAVMIIPYYAATNPGFVLMARRTIGGVLDDIDA
jgi:aminoglycoside phosphotransferase (APT) family kinase protein